MSCPQPNRFRPAIEHLETRTVLSAITPAQLRHAYGVDAISYQWNGLTIPGNGAGQTIAIVGAYHNPYLIQQVQTFNAAYGLPPADIQQINLAGSGTDLGWAEEEALDVQWAHAIAPGARLVVVEARSSSLNDLMYAVNYARQIPGVSVVTMSWGSNEFRGQTVYDAIFTTPPGHTGVTFVTATGDSGAHAGAQWPAASSNVVAVGGTSLYVDAAGVTVAENGWSDGGGGYSRIVAQPSYQRSVQSSGRRSTPDISMLGDPATGVAVYTISPVTGVGYWKIFGGTSLSAQLFGGLLAIVNMGRQLSGLGTLDGPNQTLPALYAASSMSYRDVTSGYNGYRATPGYDLATGLGTPRASLLRTLTTVTTFSTVGTAGNFLRPRLARARFRFAIGAASQQEAASGGPTAIAALHEFAPDQASAAMTPSRLQPRVNGRGTAGSRRV